MRAGTPLETIRRGLAEVWASKGRSFVTFEAKRGARSDPDLWVQYLDGELNVRWPLGEEPATALARRGVSLPPRAFVGFWAADQNAVFEVGDVLLEPLAAFVDALFASVVAGDRGYEVEARVEQHA